MRLRASECNSKRKSKCYPLQKVHGGTGQDDQVRRYIIIQMTFYKDFFFSALIMNNVHVSLVNGEGRVMMISDHL